MMISRVEKGRSRRKMEKEEGEEEEEEIGGVGKEK